MLTYADVCWRMLREQVAVLQKEAAAKELKTDLEEVIYMRERERASKLGVDTHTPRERCGHVSNSCVFYTEKNFQRIYDVGLLLRTFRPPSPVMGFFSE